MTRRIGGAGGGSDKGSGGGGGAVVAAVLAGAIAVGGAGVGAAASAGSVLDSAAVSRIQANTTKAKNPARKGNEDQAWRRMALRSLKKTGKTALTCIEYSHGQVREFFIHTPCRALHRRLLALVDEQGNIVVVSVVWVRMPSTTSARRFKQLIDTGGTGDVSPLASGLLGFEGIRFTGQYYGSRRTRSLVVVAETEPATGQPNPELLKGIAEVAAQLPPPARRG